MKKILFALSAGLPLFLASCTNQTESKSNDVAAKNLAAVNGINKCIESGDMSKLGDYIAADGVDHANPKGDIKGLENIKAELVKFHAMSPDMKFQVVKELADSEYVFQWCRFTGTSASAEMGMPVGTKYDMTAIELARMKDGKAVEHWEFMQPADMMKMMAAPPPDAGAAMPKMDSTKH